jgi:hypothetical protein
MNITTMKSSTRSDSAAMFDAHGGGTTWSLSRRPTRAGRPTQRAPYKGDGEGEREPDQGPGVTAPDTDRLPRNGAGRTSLLRVAKVAIAGHDRRRRGIDWALIAAAGVFRRMGPAVVRGAGRSLFTSICAHPCLPGVVRGGETGAPKKQRHEDQERESETHGPRASTELARRTAVMTRSSRLLTRFLGIALLSTAAHDAIADAPPVSAPTSPMVANDATVGEAPPPVDVVVKDALAPHRTFAIEWNPLSLFIDRFSLNLVIAPGEHHALVLSPFYTWANTVPFSTGIDYNGNALPAPITVEQQTFHGFGGELGYRYYFGQGGPRGFFLGPSLILAGITATAGNGSQTSFLDFGLAADAGFQALIANNWSVCVGAGLQYAMPSTSIPPQQLPASIYANQGVQPRLLLSLGYAFGN